ncbi:hypothetical protein J6590_017258 [Homalodisca vitripennis]|nr:hypothetical protein J6590_017258 [Homalodisca vitripennis]
MTQSEQSLYRFGILLADCGRNSFVIVYCGFDHSDLAVLLLFGTTRDYVAVIGNKRCIEGRGWEVADNCNANVGSLYTYRCPNVQSPDDRITYGCN